MLYFNVLHCSSSVARKYPIYMFQWHPAKPQFEWSAVKDIKHTQQAILAGQYFADLFVNQGNIERLKFLSSVENV